MEEKKKHKEHSNLYYIFLADKQNHTLPEDRAAQMWENILNHFQNE